MKGKYFVLIIALFLIYILLTSTFYFAMPFMVSWGGEMEWYLKIIAFMQDFPFRLIRKDGEVFLSLIFLNALFWTLVIGLLFFILLRLFKDKK